MSVHTWLIDIPVDECVRLLQSTPIGRLGVIVEGRPEIFPVNHVYDQETGCVSFPTEPRTKMRAALEWPWVAFEVDGSEVGREGSWSVLVVGRAEEITDQDLIGRLVQQRGIRVDYAGRGSVRWLRIRASKVTGRRVSITD